VLVATEGLQSSTRLRQIFANDRVVSSSVDARTDGLCWRSFVLPGTATSGDLGVCSGASGDQRFPAGGKSTPRPAATYFGTSLESATSGATSRDRPVRAKAASTTVLS
jgi:hypothetical protein